MVVNSNLMVWKRFTANPYMEKTDEHYEYTIFFYFALAAKDKT